MTAQELIAAEVALHDKMWGVANEHADSSKCQLARAGEALLAGLRLKQKAGIPMLERVPPVPYPYDWSGFRDYGSDIANLVIAAAYIQQEIKRKLNAGEDHTRAPRKPSQPYLYDQPNPV